MTSLRIGIVIPTWNSASALRTAVLSAKEQKGCRADVIVADSGSTDGTLDICAALGLRTVCVPPGNMYRAINTGLRQVEGDWLAYLNSDDFVYPDTYERLMSKGTTSGADVVYGSGDFVDAQGRFLYSLRAATPTTLRALFDAMFFGFMPHAAIFRKTVFEDLGGFDEGFRHISDMEFFARACFAGRRFASVSYPSVAVFRIHRDQISSREREVVQQELAHLRARWRRRNGLLGRWAVLRWKTKNAGQYLLRWLRTGSFKRAG